VWDGKSKTLIAQVGIGTGSEEHGFVGDHDVWRLPEADDKLNVKPGDLEYFIKHRPVFRAAAPGEKISPNLAGRVSAAFALAARSRRSATRRWRASTWRKPRPSSPRPRPPTSASS
jgi:hypothetical protein